MYDRIVHRGIYTITITFLALSLTVGFVKGNNEYDICGTLVDWVQMGFPSELHLLSSSNEINTTQIRILNLDGTNEIIYEYPSALSISLSPSGNYILYRTSNLEENYTSVINTQSGVNVRTNLVWSQWMNDDVLITTKVEDSVVFIHEYSPITGMMEREEQIELPGIPDESILLFSPNLDSVAYVNNLSFKENSGHAVVFDLTSLSIAWISESQIDPIEFVNTAAWSNFSDELFVGSGEIENPIIFDLIELEQMIIISNSEKNVFDLQLFPIWSPTDSLVAYWNWEQNLQLNIISLDAYSNSRVCLEVNEPSRLFWSPDERFIAFWNDIVSRLTILNIDSGNYAEVEIDQSEFHGWVWIEAQE